MITGRVVAAAVALSVVVAACGDAEPTGAPRPPTAAVPATGSSATSDALVVEVEIADGRVSTDDDRVEVSPGDTVRLVVTSDADDELHVHGVDESAPLVAGEPTILDLALPEPGLFEVETHESGLLLLQLLVQ